MSTHNVPFSLKKENHPKLSHFCSYRLLFKGLKNKFETAMVNEPSVFKPLKFCCINILVESNMQTGRTNSHVTKQL